MNKITEFIQSTKELNQMLSDTRNSFESKIEILGDIITDSERIIELCNTEIEKLDIGG